MHYDTAVCDARCPDGFQDCSNERFNPQTDWTADAPCIPRDARCTAREDEMQSTIEKRPYDQRSGSGSDGRRRSTLQTESDVGMSENKRPNRVHGSKSSSLERDDDGAFEDASSVPLWQSDGRNQSTRKTKSDAKSVDGSNSSSLESNDDDGAFEDAPSFPLWQSDCIDPDARINPHKRAYLLHSARLLDPNVSLGTDADATGALCRWHETTNARFRAEKEHAMHEPHYRGCGASDVDPLSGLTMDSIPPTVFGVYPDVNSDGEPYTTCGDMRHLSPFASDRGHLPRSHWALPDTAEWNERLSYWRARIDYHQSLDESYEAFDRAETHAELQFRIGYSHLYGKGTPVNKAEAVRWFLKSAEQGHVSAQAILGGGGGAHVANKKIAQFRTHYLTKEVAYVSTQSSGQLNTFLLNHLSVYWKVA